MNPSAAQKRLYSELRRLLPGRLPEFLTKQRWFGGKARPLASTEIADIIPMRVPSSERDALLLIVRVKYGDGQYEHYAVPILCREEQPPAAEGASTLLDIRNDESGKASVVVDALSNADFLTLLFESIEGELVFRGDEGELRGVRGKEFLQLCAAASPLAAKPRRVSGEQSNTSVIYDDRFILKFFRRIEEGINPELEIGAFLTERAHFQQVPHVAGHLEYHDKSGRQMIQGILQTFAPNRGDAWRHIIKSVAEFYELVRKHETKQGDTATLVARPRTIPRLPEFARTALESDLAAAALLGQRTAELHLALASDKTDPAFAPEPFTAEFQKAFRESLLQLTKSTLSLLRAKRLQLPPDLREKADALAQRETQIDGLFASILSAPIHAARPRIHGDYHLGQVLYTGSDFVIIDFEGEPARPLAERRAKRSPLQDVAGMMRSFHYAAFAPLLGALGTPAASAGELKHLSPWAEAWSTSFTTRFLDEYFKVSDRAAYLPASRDEIKSLLKLHFLEKAIYELNYELNNRPTWVGIPLEGIAGLLEM